MTEKKQGGAPQQKPREYEVVVGLEFHGKRAEPGEVRSDIPATSIPWLLVQGLIREVK